MAYFRRMMFRPSLIAAFLSFILLHSCSSEVPLREDLGNVPFTNQIGYDTCLVLVGPGENAALRTAMLDENGDLGFDEVTRFTGTQDPKLEVLVSKLSDTKKALMFLHDQGIELDGEHSTEGAASIMLLDQELAYTNEAPDSLVFYMSFKTMDYLRWETAFLDDFRDDPEKDFQVLSVFRGTADPNQVHMIFKVNAHDYVEKMEKNTSFRMKMLASGVVSYPVTFKLRSKEV